MTESDYARYRVSFEILVTDYGQSSITDNLIEVGRKLRDACVSRSTLLVGSIGIASMPLKSASDDIPEDRTKGLCR